MAVADSGKKTPLFDLHKAAKAKMVPFGGWMMPVSYTSVLQEHQAVREKCGMFDVSHMGEIVVKGARAGDFLQKLTMNDVTRLGDGQGQYSGFLHPSGGFIDDIILYRLSSDHFFVCVNASNADKDYAWVREHAADARDVHVTNESHLYSQIAVQGPCSKAAVEHLIAASDKPAFEQLDYMGIMQLKLFGQECLLARTGYTGEWGYELYIPNEIASRCWLGLGETQRHSGIQPIGLGARDTLRLEACYLLYGNDMNDAVSPLEAGVSWAVRLEAGDFIGRDALIHQKTTGLERLMFAFHMEDEGIPRHDMDVYKGEELIGKVTSGSVLPTVGGAGGMALLNPKKAAIGDTVEIDVRGKRKLARLVKKPLYKAKVKA